jgi:hypothetical protein
MIVKCIQCWKQCCDSENSVHTLMGKKNEEGKLIFLLRLKISQSENTKTKRKHEIV